MRGRLVEIAAICVLGTLAITATAQASAVTDPRKCSTVTPGGSAKHAYWCAHDAAVATVKAVMARRQHVTRWYAPTFCNQAGTLLRWSCTTALGGQAWKVAVRWTATSTGWHRYATVTGP